MAFHWDDPVWAAEQRRKIAEAKLRKKEEREALTPARALRQDAAWSNTRLTEKWENEKADMGPEFRYPDPPDHIEGLHKTVVNLGSEPVYVQFGDAGSTDSIAPAPSVTGDCDGYRTALMEQVRALVLLRKLFQALQLRDAGYGYQKGKCLACDRPHFHGVCPKRCACHEVAAYLEQLDGAGQ